MAREFGRDFKRSLFVVVKSGKVTQDYCEALDDDYQSYLIKSERLRNFVYSCNRATLSWLSDFCRIDLLADDRSEATWRRKRWPYVVLLVLLLNAAKLVEYLQRQYRYDFALFTYEQLKAQLNRTQPNDIVWPTLSERFGKSYKQLKSLEAASHSEWPFIFEIAILYYLPPALIFHVIDTYLYDRTRSVLFPLRAILDESNEAFTWVRLVIDELEHLIRDSLAFTSSKCDQISDNLILSTRLNRPLDRRRSSKLMEVTRSRVLMSSSQRLSTRHQFLVAHLKQLALQGRLNRFQRSPKCRDQLELVFFISIWGLLFYLVTWLALFIWYFNVVFHKTGRTLTLNNPSKLLDTTSLICLIAIAIPAACLYVAILNTTVWDQLLYMKKTRIIMKHLIRVNSHRLFHMISISSMLKPQDHHMNSQLRNLNNSIEEDLFVAILQWRLASRTFELMRRPVTRLVFTIVYATISVTVLFRLHSPYLEDEIRRLGVIVGMLSIVLAVVCVVPLAFLHEHWAAVFKSLWSVVALLGRLESVPIIRERLCTSSSVSIFTLRREVSDSLQRHERFTCRVLTMPITYSNLIRAAAWLVLISSSLLDSQNNLFGEWFGQYMRDPFNLLDRKT